MAKKHLRQGTVCLLVIGSSAFFTGCELRDPEYEQLSRAYYQNLEDCQKDWNRDNEDNCESYLDKSTHTWWFRGPYYNSSLSTSPSGGAAGYYYDRQGQRKPLPFAPTHANKLTNEKVNVLRLSAHGGYYAKAQPAAVQRSVFGSTGRRFSSGG